LLAGLRAGGHVTGDNEPYSGFLQGDTLWQHGTQAGLAHALVEIRQDLIADENGQREWAENLATLIEGFLANPALAASFNRVTHFGSRSDLCSNITRTAYD
jgi:predicted N-formylglutamate amidohydrolase